MEKNRLLLLPFFVGLVLMIWSWYLSYPLPISANDFIFNHISILYWLSLPLLLASMFLMALTTKSNFLKWILSIGIVLTFFSLSYFYSMMPGSDSQSFRGLTEYFTQTKILDISIGSSHIYYQWPAFFVLADIVTSVSGLPLANYEFLLYTIVGFLLTTALYVYASKKDNVAGFLTVAAFFISATTFINYQAVPFSLALGLLFLLFMLETHQMSTGLMVSMLVLYACLLITHSFVPLFFALYLLARSLFDKNRQNRNNYRNLFLIALVSYFLVEITLAKFSFGQLIISLTEIPEGSYSSIVAQSVAPSSVQVSIGVIAQFLARTVIIAFIGLCVAGFILLFVKRKMGSLDKAILLAGVVYIGLGAVLNTLGSRAIVVALIPISLGAAFLFKGKFKPYLAGLFLVLLVLFLFVPLNQSFNTSYEIMFQTRETYIADNFFLNHYNWENPGFVVAGYSAAYLTSKLGVSAYINQWLDAGDNPDAILYTPQFVGLGLGNYSSMESLSQGEKVNLVYNDGFSYVLVNGQHSNGHQ